jgi:hypothetical protein
MPFELDKRDVREVYSAVGSFALAEGNPQKVFVFITFPFFILWVKLVKICNDLRNMMANFAIKIIRGISIWKT